MSVLSIISLFFLHVFFFFLSLSLFPSFLPSFFRVCVCVCVWALFPPCFSPSSPRFSSKPFWIREYLCPWSSGYSPRLCCTVPSRSFSLVEAPFLSFRSVFLTCLGCPSSHLKLIVDNTHFFSFQAHLLLLPLSPPLSVALATWLPKLGTKESH